MSTLPTISVNSQVSESLSTTDFYYAPTGSYGDFYTLEGLTAGQTVSVGLDSNNFDAFVGVINLDSWEIVAWDDNSGSGTNSSATFTPTFGDEGSYAIVVTSTGPNSTGNYSLAVGSQSSWYA